MSPELSEAWEWVKSRCPQEDWEGVEIVPVEAGDLRNISNTDVPCAEAGLDTRTIIIADDKRCTHRPYLDQVLMHELGHIVLHRSGRGNSEVLADAYTAQYWNFEEKALSWPLRLEEPYWSPDHGGSG